MGSRIAIVGTGAVGGYAGAHMAQAGEDVTFIDPWPEHVEHMKKHGLRVTHAKEVAEFTVPVRALHLTEVQQLAKEKPVDIAFVCTKSYDTAWATMMIQQYLAPDGFVVSLQNCMNEETIAGVVGWGKTLGCIASSITVNLPDPGHIHRGAGKQAARRTPCSAPARCTAASRRAPRRSCRLVGTADSAMVTPNLWGERWSKLVANVMGNGLSACTGLSGRADAAERCRSAASRPGSAARRSASARRWATSSRRSCTCRPRPSRGPARATTAAMKVCDEQRFKDSRARSSAEQRPSMGQDMQKGRRTEIEFLNGYVVREGEKVGIAAPRQRRAHRHRQARREGRAEARPAAHRGAAAELTGRPGSDPTPEARQ